MIMRSGIGLAKVGELGNFIREQRRTASLSLRKLSHMAGISNPYLSQIERGMRHPSAEILQAIAKALRISAETMYVKAGILEERPDGVDPIHAILRDSALSEKQKQVIVDIYRSFRHENELEATERTAATAKAIAEQGEPVAEQGKAAVKKIAAARKPAAKRTAAAAKPRRASKMTKPPAMQSADSESTSSPSNDGVAP